MDFLRNFKGSVYLLYQLADSEKYAFLAISSDIFATEDYLFFASLEEVLAGSSSDGYLVENVSQFAETLYSTEPIQTEQINTTVDHIELHRMPTIWWLLEVLVQAHAECVLKDSRYVLSDFICTLAADGSMLICCSDTDGTVYPVWKPNTTKSLQVRCDTQVATAIVEQIPNEATFKSKGKLKSTLMIDLSSISSRPDIKCGALRYREEELLHLYNAYYTRLAELQGVELASWFKRYKQDIRQPFVPTSDRLSEIQHNCISFSTHVDIADVKKIAEALEQNKDLQKQLSVSLSAESLADLLQINNFNTLTEAMLNKFIEYYFIQHTTADHEVFAVQSEYHMLLASLSIKIMSYAYLADSLALRLKSHINLVCGKLDISV